MVDSIKERLKKQEGSFKRRLKSPEDWRAYWLGHEKSKAPDWIFKREVHIFRTSEVREENIPYIQAGIEHRVQELGLDFSVVDYGTDSYLTQLVRDSTNDGNIDDTEIRSHLSYNGINEDYALVIVANGLLLPDEKGKVDWGRSFFDYGSIIFGLENGRRAIGDFLKQLANHEAGHLFGFMRHHDEDNVKGYAVVDDCNMLWRASTMYTCEKCTDALTYFWKGIEERTGEKFFLD